MRRLRQLDGGGLSLTADRSCLGSKLRSLGPCGESFSSKLAMVVAEIRWRQVVNVLATVAWAERKHWVEPDERKPSIFRSRSRIGTCEPSARLF